MGLIPRRAVLAILFFLGCFFTYMLRVNFSIILLAMVKSTSKTGGIADCVLKDKLNKDIGEKQEADSEGDVEDILPDYGPRYSWSQETQGQVNGAYFYGMMLSSIPGGMAAEAYGGTKVVAYGSIIPALLNLALPWSADIHVSLVFILRFFIGFCGGVCYPGIQTMIARWAPPLEKGVFIWTMQGGPFGASITNVICGFIISTLGWHAAFYLTSGMIFVFYILWVWLAYDSPDEDPYISDTEKNYIKESLGSSVVAKRKKPSIPLKSIATSVPFMALLFAYMANMWGIYLLATVGPKYALEVLGFDMKSTGALSGVPLMSRLVSGAIFAAVGDYCRKSGLLTHGNVRHGFMIFSHVIPAFCLLGTTYAGCNAILAMAMLIIGLTLNGAVCQTCLGNHQDLAPNFAGTLYGFMNLFGAIPGFVIPVLIGVLVRENNGVEEWRTMFLISAGVYLTSTAFFWTCGSVQIQPWNTVTE